MGGKMESYEMMDMGTPAGGSTPGGRKVFKKNNKSAGFIPLTPSINVKNSGNSNKNLSPVSGTVVPMFWSVNVIVKLLFYNILKISTGTFLSLDELLTHHFSFDTKLQA